VSVGDQPGTYSFVVVAVGDGTTKTVEATLTVTGGRKCLVATATYGGELADEVQFLREFRDKTVMSSFLGRSFMRAFNKFYYTWSPTIADEIEENQLLKHYVMASLYPLIYTLKACYEIFQPVLSLQVEAAILSVGLASSIVLGMIYLAPTLFLVELVFKLKIGAKVFKLILLCFSLSLSMAIASYFIASISMAMISTFTLVMLSAILGGASVTALVEYATRKFPL